MPHFNFDFSAVQVIWTLTFAALLVLLVVLMGRDRMRRYPWFSLSIVLMTLDLLGKRLLHGRLPQLTLAEIFITLGDVALIVGLLVLVELARRAFGEARRKTAIVAALAVVVIAAVLLALWGPWPAWKTLTANSFLAVLGLMQLAEQKGELLVGMLTVELGVLVVLFGRRFNAGWRSHTQQITIGLSAAAISLLAARGSWQYIAMHALPQSEAEYERLLGLRDKIFNANATVYVAVLVWWIVCLWIDEPGTAAEMPADISVAAGEVEITEEPAVDPIDEEKSEL
jgi:hypothetical protein